MGMDLVPYGFTSPELPRQSTPILPGQVCVVTFILTGEAGWIVDRLRVWYQDRNEVALVATGTSGAGFGFVTLEWEECEADQLLLDILRHEEIVDDFLVYTRELEG